jgi:hypothetical protein
LLIKAEVAVVWLAARGSLSRFYFCATNPAPAKTRALHAFHSQTLSGQLPCLATVAIAPGSLTPLKIGRTKRFVAFLQGQKNEKLFESQ